MSSCLSRSGGIVIGHDVEPVVEILAEAPSLDDVVQVPVRRGDDAHVHLAIGVLADAADLAFLEHAEQLDLERERHLADLVEEDGAAVATSKRPVLSSPRR